jgi:putative transposase
MTRGLKRFQASGQSHFITFSCYRRLPNLSELQFCEGLLAALEAARKHSGMRVYGFVLMPEHVHLLVSEPDRSTLADVIRSVKFSSAKRVRRLRANGCGSGPFWQKRYYDRNIRNYRDFLEKLRYIHRNPVKRGLVENPEDWAWSSFRHYVSGEAGIVEIESEWTAGKRECEADRAPPSEETTPG